MHRLVFMVVSVLIFAGCKTDNRESCERLENAENVECSDAGTHGGQCTNPSDCTNTPNYPVCDTGNNGGTCVQCTTGQKDLCMGMTPRCEADVCVACVDDNDCGGTGVCLPSGACADPDTIIHAISTGGSMNTTTCGGMGVGNACDLDTALSIAQTEKNVIKLDDIGPYKAMMNNFIVNTDISIGLIIDARNAILQHNAVGPIFTINAGKGMTLLGGTLEGAQGGGGDGILCKDPGVLTIHGTTLQMNEESGIDSSNCLLTITKAIIRDNSKATSGTFPGVDVSKGSIAISQSQIISNKGGGITVGSNGKFTVVGNAFLGNGNIGDGTGGFSAMTSATGNRLEFNTFIVNKSQPPAAPGIQCMAPAGFIAKYNIVWNNDNGVAGAEVGGSCPHTYSDIGPALTAVSGMGNIKDDPLLTNDGHLQANSPAIKKADGADLTDIASKDIDGHPRIAPADLGAYQAPR